MQKGIDDSALTCNQRIKATGGKGDKHKLATSFGMGFGNGDAFVFCGDVGMGC
jgi:hypothetical protein